MSCVPETRLTVPGNQRFDGVTPRQRLRGQLNPNIYSYSPSHFDSSSKEIGSSFGGARVTGTLGSNLDAMLEDSGCWWG
jgi:hypothetical protein